MRTRLPPALALGALAILFVAAGCSPHRNQGKVFFGVRTSREAPHFRNLLSYQLVAVDGKRPDYIAAAPSKDQPAAAWVDAGRHDFTVKAAPPNPPPGFNGLEITFPGQVEPGRHYFIFTGPVLPMLVEGARAK